MIRRQQLSVEIPEALIRKIRSLSASHGQSVDEWMVPILELAVNKELSRNEVARAYAPGRALTLDEMMALADAYAESETVDVIETRYVPIRDA